jgi:hypothetical protein
LRRLRFRALGPLALFAAVVLAVNMPNYVRQIRTYGSPLGPREEPANLSLEAQPYGNDTHSPAAIFSNVLRNATTELLTPFERLTSGFEWATRAIHRLLRLDPDDPRITLKGGSFHIYSGRWADENFAGNPLHFMLILAACALVAVRPPAGSSHARAYALCLVGGFFFFSAMIRWNAWVTRVLLPLLIAGTPLVGLALHRLGRQWPAFTIALLALALAVPVAIYNRSRPLVGPNAYYNYDRLTQYYLTVGPDLMNVHQQMAQAATTIPCRNVGLRLGRDDWEYPLWLQFRACGVKCRFEHIGVDNPSARYYRMLPPFEPDLTVTIQLSENRINLARRP